MTSWIEVSEERLAGNYRAIAEAVGTGTDVLAVIKANAYGHGAERCAVMLARVGAGWMGVACPSEGERVRRALCDAGIGQDRIHLLVMSGFLPEDVAAIAENALTPTVWMPEQVGWLQGTGVTIHIEVDTGMSRQGVHPGEEMEDLLSEIQAAGLKLNGIFTHFCAAEVAHSELTQKQERQFEAAVAQVRTKGIALGWVHAGSTSSVDNPAQASPWLVDLAKSVGAQAMVRCGCALYGYCVPIDGAGAESKLRAALKPVMTWKTRVASLRELAVGETVSYNATYTAKAPMRLAMLPVGYSDGLRRALSCSNERAGGWVMIHGRDGVDHCAKIVGRVTMNLTMVDVSGIEDVRLGDEVVVLGDGTTADDHARLAGTIPYEILCGVRG